MAAGVAPSDWGFPFVDRGRAELCENKPIIGEPAMDKTFTAYRIHQIEKQVVARFEELTLADLNPGEVVVKVAYSSVNYKDALAATGKGKILRRFPLVGGIDLAGTVVSSLTNVQERPEGTGHRLGLERGIRRWLH